MHELVATEERSSARNAVTFRKQERVQGPCKIAQQADGLARPGAGHPSLT